MKHTKLILIFLCLAGNILGHAQTVPPDIYKNNLLMYQVEFPSVYSDKSRFWEEELLPFIGLQDLSLSEMEGKQINLYVTDFHDVFGKIQINPDSVKKYKVSDYDPITKKCQTDSCFYNVNSRDTVFTKSIFGKNITLVPQKWEKKIITYNTNGSPLWDYDVDYDVLGNVEKYRDIRYEYVNSMVVSIIKTVSAKEHESYFLKYAPDRNLKSIKADIKKMASDDPLLDLAILGTTDFVTAATISEAHQSLHSFYAETYFEVIRYKAGSKHWEEIIGYYYDDGKRINKFKITREIIDKVAEYEAAEKKRIEEEKQKASEEAERQARIDEFLKMREDKVYTISDINRNLYDTYKNKLSQKLSEIIQQVKSENMDFTIEDNAYISYGGKTEHDINIAGELSSSTKSRIEQALQSVDLQPLVIQVEGTKESFPVNCQDVYRMSVSVSNEQLVLKKGSDIKLKKGNKKFYADNYGAINRELHNKGLYTISANNTLINNQSNTDVRVNKVRRIPNIMIGYSFSKAAPFGLSIGLNNINASILGVYATFHTSLNSSKEEKHELFEDDVMTSPQVAGFNCFNVSAGLTCSITRFGYIYAGAGYGECGRRYANETKTSFYKATPVSGLNIEAGLIIRPIKWLGISAGYNMIPGQTYGEANFGIMVFL